MSNTTNPTDPTRITVYPAILSYPNLFVPRKPKDGDDSEAGYDCELWFYNSNPKAGEVYHKLQTAVQAAAEDKFGKGSVPKNLKSPIRLSSEKESWVGEEGFWIRAKSKAKPQVSEKDPASSPQNPVFIPVTDHEKVYAGVIVAASIRAAGFTFTDAKKMTIKGVTLYLNQVVLVAPGTRLVASHVRPPEEEFGDIAGQMDFQPIVTDVGPQAAHQMGQMSYPGQPQMPGLSPQQFPPQQFSPQQYPGVPGFPAQPMMYPPMTPPGYGMPPGVQYPPG